MSQFICSSCENKILKEEPFYNISLEVNKLKNLNDSMKLFVEGEVINEFYCGACKKKSDITKSVKLSKLPNNLIFNLKRIHYDLDYQNIIKINSKFEFPIDLDLAEFF